MTGLSPLRIWTLALSLPLASEATRPMVVSVGCQGEACGIDRNWVSDKSQSLFVTPGGARRVGTVRRGMKAQILAQRILTLRVGHGLVTQALTLHALEKTGAVVELHRGSRLRTLYYDSEGVVIAIAPSGQRIGIDQDDFRQISRFFAEDWWRVRLADGRVGWIKAGDSSCLGDVRLLPRNC